VGWRNQLSASTTARNALQFAWFGGHAAADSKAAKHEARVTSGDAAGHHSRAGDEFAAGKTHHTPTSRNKPSAKLTVSARAISRHDRANVTSKQQHDLSAEAQPISNRLATTTPNGKTTDALTSPVATWRQVSERDRLPVLAWSQRSR
jgi:hypothetical protein